MLLAYLLSRRGGQWQVGVHRVLAPLLGQYAEEWAAQRATAWLLHVGFDPPDPSGLEDVVSSMPGRVFVTSAARWALPPGFDVLPRIVGTLGGPGRQPVFLGRKGWVGQELVADSDVPGTAGLGEDSLAGSQTALEEQYAFEATTSVQELVRHAPAWLLDTHVRSLALTVRLRNIFDAHAISHVRDLLAYDDVRFLQLKNCGRKSFRVLVAALRDAWRAGLEDGHEPSKTQTHTDPTPVPGSTGARRSPSSPSRQGRTLLGTLRDVLKGRGPREQQIFARRLGASGAVETLEAIAADLGISRERVRQLENRAFGLLADPHRTLARQTKAVLSRLLKERREPLYVDLLGAEDSWFAGLEDAPSALYVTNLLCLLSADRCRTLEIQGRSVLSEASVSTWSELVQLALQNLESLVAAQPTEGDVMLAVESVSVAAGAPELTLSLQEAVRSRVKFLPRTTGGEAILAAVSEDASARAVVVERLESSQVPLCVEELSRLLEAETGESWSAGRTRKILRASGARPFQRGVFGLRQHLGLSDDELSELRSAAEALIEEGGDGRQWHTSEIVAALHDDNDEDGDGVGSVALDFALDGSERVTYLGRKVWAARRSRTQVRHGVMDLCAEAVRKAGRPLSEDELKEAVSRVRGVNHNFLLVPRGGLARAAPRVWGLLERDFGTSPEEQRRLLDNLADALRARGRAFHSSEISGVIPVPVKLTPYMVASIAGTDTRFRLGRGGLIGLAEWSDLGRLTVREAVQVAVAELGDRLTTDGFVNRVQALLEREVEERDVLDRLRWMGFRLDNLSNSWTRPVASTRGSGDVADDDEP